MASFEFATATKIVFGVGKVKELPTLCTPYGKSACVVTGAKPERHASITDALRGVGHTVISVQVSGEPTTDVLMDLVGKCKAASPSIDYVIAIGGGSVIDAGKALAALVVSDLHVMEHLEVIGGGKPLAHDPLPFVAVPTTSGTGAEVTKNAVLTSTEHKVKVSLRSNAMLPNLALVDPALTLSVPPAVTASTGLDAFTQVIEPFTSCLANPITDALAREGIALIARSLRQAFLHGDVLAHRRDMSLGSLLGGLALANSKLGAVHGFAGPVGGVCGAPHGVVCARFLPHVIDINVKALQERDSGNPALGKYTQVARIITGRDDATAQDAVTWIQELCTALEVPPLSQYGVTPDMFDMLCEKAAKSSSMKGNPITLTSDELHTLIAKAVSD